MDNYTLFGCIFGSEVIDSFLENIKTAKIEELNKEVSEFLKNHFDGISLVDIRKDIIREIILRNLGENGKVTALSRTIGISREQLEKYVSKKICPNYKNSSILLNTLDVTEDEKDCFWTIEGLNRENNWGVLKGRFCGFVVDALKESVPSISRENISFLIDDVFEKNS